MASQTVVHSVRQSKAPTQFNLDLVEGFDKWLMVQNFSTSTRVNYCHDVRGFQPKFL
jgi:hypothetical protein